MTQTVDAALRRFAPQLPLGVAYSGGADSTALLLACALRWPGQVVALHVNHGIQEAAARFESHCSTVCTQLGLPLAIAKVQAHPHKGQSPEDAARIARYQALVALAHQAPGGVALQSIALAQHADDQVETLLIALARGSGLPGLSGMPAHWQRDGLQFYRPLLGVSGADVRRWLAAHNVPYVDDPTNQDPRFTRNRIRAQVVPPLQAAFPHFRESFARVAQHAAQAQELLDALAEQDFEVAHLHGGDSLRIATVRGLSTARRANLVRFWLKQRFGVMPSTAQLEALLLQIEACKTRGHAIHIKVGDGFALRRGEALTWYNRPVLHPQN